MNWTMPYPWRSRRDSVRRINMSSEPGNESFFCAFRPIPRILSQYKEFLTYGDEITPVKFNPQSFFCEWEPAHPVITLNRWLSGSGGLDDRDGEWPTVLRQCQSE